MQERPNLDDLMLFYEVVNVGSLTKASANLHVAKSTVSRRLKNLEKQVGAQLLKRNPRKLALTEIGSDLHARCGRIDGELRDAGRRATQLQSDMQGMLRVSVPIEFGVRWLGAALSEFATRYPEIGLDVDMHSGVVDLIEQPYDIAIQLGKLIPSRLTCRRLATLSRGVYASPAYLARRGTPRSIEEYRRHECVLTGLQQREGLWSFRSQARYRKVGVTSRVIVNSIRLARELVIGGVGLGLLPNVLCVNDVKANRLVRLLTSWRATPLHVAAMILSRDRIPQKTRVFLDFVAERLARDEAVS